MFRSIYSIDAIGNMWVVHRKKKKRDTGLLSSVNCTSHVTQRHTCTQCLGGKNDIGDKRKTDNVDGRFVKLTPNPSVTVYHPSMVEVVPPRRVP